MVKIIVNGDQSRMKTVRFECEDCGCVFEANATEYWEINGTYYCNCPFCGQEVET